MTLEQQDSPFDETFYLRRYPDAANAVKIGTFPDAWSHYQEVGKLENREICAFDATWYLNDNPDVKKAIAAGGPSSALRHYLKYGFFEGRTPLPGSKAKRVFAYGSFGSNNVGDEAILEGVKRLYPDCIQIYHNKPRTGTGFQPHIIFETPGFFKSEDYLILGGGGLLYDRETVALMIRLAQAAVDAGARVDICRLGCEAAKMDYRDEVKTLFSLARSTSVRSTYSQQIISEMTGIVPEVQFDFAFFLKDEVRAHPRKLLKQPTIGIVTASSNESELRQLADALRPYTRKGVKDPIHFVFIPHSHSYFDIRNNDCVAGESLWSAMALHDAISEDMFQLRPFDADPLSTLAFYRQLDAVVSSRYHGLIFAMMAEVPTLLLGGGLIKLRSFVADHPSELLSVAENMGDFPRKLQPLIDAVREQRNRQWSALSNGRPLV